jgi:hypothetical protein
MRASANLVLLSRQTPFYTPAMRRALEVYLLIAVMLMQTVVWLSPYAVAAQTEQLAHMTVHVHDVDHHHHDDESLHLSSDSDSAAPHFHVDNGFQPIGLTALAVKAGFGALPNAPPHTVLSEPPSVFLDGLLRPPSATA